jgi:hypothetical protein
LGSRPERKGSIAREIQTYSAEFRDLGVAQALTGLIGARGYLHESRQRKLSDHADGTAPLF